MFKYKHKHKHGNILELVTLSKNILKELKKNCLQLGKTTEFRLKRGGGGGKW